MLCLLDKKQQYEVKFLMFSHIENYTQYSYLIIWKYNYYFLFILHILTFHKYLSTQIISRY